MYRLIYIPYTHAGTVANNVFNAEELISFYRLNAVFVGDYPTLVEASTAATELQLDCIVMTDIYILSQDANGQQWDWDDPGYGPTPTCYTLPLLCTKFTPVNIHRKTK